MGPSFLNRRVTSLAVAALCAVQLIACRSEGVSDEVPAPEVAEVSESLAPDPSLGFVSARDGYFYLRNLRFKHVGANTPQLVYQPLWQVDETLNKLRDARVKHVRVLLPNDKLTTQAIGDRLQQVLNRARDRGMFVTVALTHNYSQEVWGWEKGDPAAMHAVRGDRDPAWNPTGVSGNVGFYSRSYSQGNMLDDRWIHWGHTANYKSFAVDIATRFKNDNAIFAWDIANEVNSTGGPGMVDYLVAFYRTMAAALKAADPNHMVTTGMVHTGWAGMTDAQRNLVYRDANIDYLTVHMYNTDPAQQHQGALDELWRADNMYAKPVIVEELGHTEARNNYSVLANQYQDLYVNRGVDAVMQWGVTFTCSLCKCARTCTTDPNDWGAGDCEFGPCEQQKLPEYVALAKKWGEWTHAWNVKTTPGVRNESLPCSTWDGDVAGCDAHGYADPNKADDTQHCAYYFCSNRCAPQGTSNCEAGCTSYCAASNSETWSCNSWNGNVSGCDAHGYADTNKANDTQNCAYYFCSNTCAPQGTSNCEAGCSSYCF
ncbi:glycoside hydrolase family 2 TIM barrel-domain containing protein [Pyxidicoccus xibeiensis]|uniref:glycoside hydrolase family 2 TIM barrel-domain containing protein n=1 Tax=Pyxidicoccus xibeiensis TaxID=2906759 RepID=UPI0020A6DBF7|nr:glycoside hydrolase family 2 TIM barrel-domain containing protein [Pyxidicoccus xibeiensis]MCP3138112.1 glycoside hydrolase family 5 protein [Pyxidicoccus xibeiensis]